MKELDELLQHHGVLGMKWGVRKDIKSFVKNRNAKANANLDKYHDKRKNQKIYKLQYKTNRAILGSHRKAVRATRADRMNMKLGAATALSPIAIEAGRRTVSGVRKFASNPENIRRGKNLVQAIKRSNIRYVDGNAMKNVITPERLLIGRW